MEAIKQPAERFELRTPKPPYVRINRKITILLSGIAFLILMTSIWYGLSPRDHHRSEGNDGSEAENMYDTGLPENFNALPSSYAQLSKASSQEAQVPSDVPQLGPPAPGEAGAMRVHAAQSRPRYGSAHRPSADDALKKEIEAARRSPISFKRLAGSERKTGQALDPNAPYPADLGLLNPSGAEIENTRYANDQNMQGEKRHWMDNASTEETTVNASLTPAISPFSVLAGAVIPASLVTGINSDLPGQIVAQVRENVYDTVSGGYLLVPQGSRLIGLYDSVVAYGQERVLIAWNRLIMPNGHSILLEGMPGVDMSGYAGMKDRVNHHWVRLISGVVLSSLLSVGARTSQGNVSEFQPSVEQDFARQISEDINQAGQKITQKNLNIQPTIEIRPGFSFNVMVHKDLILKPYSS